MLPLNLIGPKGVACKAASGHGSRRCSGPSRATRACCVVRASDTSDEAPSTSASCNDGIVAESTWTGRLARMQHATSRRAHRASTLVDEDACSSASGVFSRFVNGAIATLGAAVIVSSSVMLPAGPAEALLSSPNAQIARSVDAALRRAIPAFNPEVKKIQRSLEEVQYLLRIPQRKPWASMAESVTEALDVSQRREVMLAGLSAAAVPTAEPLLNSLSTSLRKLELAVKTQQPDAVALRVSDALKAVAELELLQAPGLPFLIPKEYASLPRLVGRAVVELTFEKRDGSLGFLDPVAGGPAKRATLRLTLDGYSAPLSAGAFLRNVKEGLYDGRSINANYTSVLVTAPEGKTQPPVPLEIMPLGEFEPLYRLPLDVQSGELPVLPLSISGAVTFARLPTTDSYLSGTDWFVYKFDKQQAGLGGLAFDEGQFGVFGYVTEGLEGVLPRLAPGDIIVEAKVVSGGDKLVVP